MRARADLPRRVREIENVWIPLSDGCRLAARVWLPEDAEAAPVPALLEAIPYRKSDWTAARDTVRHPYLAGHGYAAVRVDLRGSGDSDGLLLDEYLPREQDDLVEAIAWLAAQPWCTGAVGMFGISWGGFNALQVASRRPPALGAIITICSTDDRYADDVHYAGGCVLAIDMLPWASQMLVWNAVPPAPEVVGPGWRKLWLERLERTPPYVEEWLRHQLRDGYWRHGSVREDYGAIRCPVYAVGGWADGYTNAIPRLLEGLSCPRKGLIGPWAHAFPEEGIPGPPIGFLQESLRWWDHWLKGIDTGIMAEPMLRAWLQEPARPRTRVRTHPGRWVAEPAWPPGGLEPRAFHLGRGTLGAKAEPELELVHSSPQATGLDSGLWCPYGDAADLPGDQRIDDGLSLAFDSPPLERGVELLGFPELRLVLAADRPRALIAARLCDVAPDGSSALVTRGYLNLTHRDGHERPEPLEPGRRYEITVRLDATGYAYRPGHRIRLALSTCYWPMLWPSPEPVALTVVCGASRLVLPVRAPSAADRELRPFEPPEGTPPLDVVELSPGYSSRTVTRDLFTGRVELAYVYGGGERRLPDGTVIDDSYRETFSIVEGAPLSARVETAHTVAVGRGPERRWVEARSAMWADAERFHTRNEIEAYDRGERLCSRRFDASAPRELV
ncbi:MAG: CocE/NonD family hydrolase [Thermoleophilia bacterium]|nr:CocE/NonD family hydrolase [Thermoleophilia bacterium]